MLANKQQGSDTQAADYFIADLHLDPDKHQAYELALAFFRQIRSARSLYILGDLFEYWIGDDAGLDLYKDVIDELHSLSQSGVPLFVMLGNRDFLLGDDFARATGATLVREDEMVIRLDDEPVLLMHGDTLCTEDSEYQGFRQQLRSHQWQSQFLNQSIEQRTAQALALREHSKEHSAGKTRDIMDVTESSVKQRMASTNCSTLIHGHTHRPAIHADAKQGRRRFVVGDWHEDHAQYVVHQSNGLELCRFDGQLSIT